MLGARRVCTNKTFGLPILLTDLQSFFNGNQRNVRFFAIAKLPEQERKDDRFGRS